MLPNADKENEAKCNNLVGKLHNNNVTDELGAEHDKPQKVSSVGNVHHDTIQITGKNLSKVPSHNKPKKASSTGIVRQDYICNQYDHQIITPVKSMPLSGKEILVHIGNNDAIIDRKFLDCLFQNSGPSAYLNDEVINAYISLMKTEDHLKNRAGGTVFMETTFISAILKRDGDKDILIDENDKIETKSKERMVSLYTDHDMVFLPINIKESHWYLAVINAKRKEIQILDSTGPKDRSDLIDTLNGLQRHIDILLHHNKLSESKWPDLQVASWPYREIFQDHLQKDDCSCGLFMINYIEYWDGNGLTDIFDQNDMTQFRTKLAAILLTTDLNKLKACPLTKNSDDDIGSPSDVGHITSNNKRKKCHNDNDEEITKHYIQEGHNKMIDHTPVNELLRLLHDDGEVVDVPTKEDLMDIVCDMIVMINDAAVLETKWVRSFSPYPISISLKQIQEFLQMEKHMSHDLFNMGVRILATTEHQNLKSSNQRVIKHYMDLRFCAISNFGYDPNFRKKVEARELANTLRSCSSLQYDISHCKYILLPYSISSTYTLFVLDHTERTLMMFDTSPIQNWCQDIPYKRFVKKILNINVNYAQAVRHVCPRWFEDIFLWKNVPMEDTPIVDQCLSGDMVLQIMSAFNGSKGPMSICTDGRKLRKKFLVDLLTYDGNKSQFLIPPKIQDYLSQITGKSTGKI